MHFLGNYQSLNLNLSQDILHDIGKQDKHSILK